jgi:DNA-binding NarL/FixJ family response regulator
MLAAMKAGAHGYVTKGTDRNGLLAAVRAVSQGSTIFDASSRSDLFGPRRPVELTSRELDVLKLVAAGRTNAEIARELCIATKTVERVVAGAVSKLGARNRAHGVARAIALRLIEAPS